MLLRVIALLCILILCSTAAVRVQLWALLLALATRFTGACIDCHTFVSFYNPPAHSVTIDTPSRRSGVSTRAHVTVALKSRPSMMACD